MDANLLEGLPIKAPPSARGKLRFVDVAVTATAKEFAGIYRGKQQHEADFSAVLKRAFTAGCEKVMLTGMSLNDVEFNLRFARSEPERVYITIGVHPYHVAEMYEEPHQFVKLQQLVQASVESDTKHVAAFGEIGLDYDHLEWANKETQQRAFREQLDIAVKFDLPLFLHCRAAFDDFVSIISPYLRSLPKRGLVHSFVGSKNEMEALVDMGFDISVNGFSFKTAESLNMTAAIPLDRLQLETDAPWGIIQATSDVAKKYLIHVPPVPSSKKRDKFEMGLMVKDRNESCMIDRVACIVAGLKSVSVEEVAEAAWQNSTRMFGLGVDTAAVEVQI